MYTFITGPLLWLSISIFVIGCLVHVVLYVKDLDSGLDRVAYNTCIACGLKGALRSIVLWLTPFGTRCWRLNPIHTILFYLFHVGAVIAPLFVSAHGILLSYRWGISLPAIPDVVADSLTACVLLGACGLLIRRMVLPEVRQITRPADIALLLLSVAPFATALMAAHQIGDVTFWTVAHILSGELFLVAVPFTKLSHIVLFFCSRIQIGMDFSIKRGGMKSPGFPW